ncbi:MAG: magnesium/cobalt transporter CorA [Saprospiraceae bacterium]|nr:magnesium/cobalt transporter CorA [Saprospiraceae bacterium]
MRKRKNTGLSPGHLVYTGEQKVDPSTIRQVYYNESEISESMDFKKDPLHISDSFKLWTEVYGIHDVKLIQKIGLKNEMHSLVMEDIVDITNRVKIEVYDEGIFCIIQLLKLDELKKHIKSEQISIFFNDNNLISFQQDPDDSLATVRKRMYSEGSRIRSRKCDYLFFALLDYIVDCYFLITDTIDDEINKIEERLHRGLDHELIVDIYSVRTKLIKFRNFTYPLREEINRIKKTDSRFIHDETLIFIRDLEDHLIKIIEISDNQRELLNGIKDVIFSQSSLKLNQDIKWLTVISTISVPIVILTGIYGMNFENMPEIHWKYGYLSWWIVTATIIFSLIIFFRRKKLF